MYFEPKITEIIPLVNGTVESHNIPRIEANNKTVTSVLGKKTKIKNKRALSE